MESTPKEFKALNKIIIMEERLRNRIIINPKIMAGKPVIKGTRIPVDAVIQRIADGMSIDEVLKGRPELWLENTRYL